MQPAQQSISNATRLNMQRLVMLRGVVMACLSFVLLGFISSVYPLALRASNVSDSFIGAA